MDKENKSSLTMKILFVVVLVVVLLSGIYVSCKKFYLHEKRQNTNIRRLQEQVQLLLEKENNNEKIVWREGAFHYLAIGNSITSHPTNDYWWNEIGMAASTEEKDYFHLVTSHLKEKYSDVEGHTFGFYVWEIQSHDRAETLELLDAQLDSEVDLITIQLSENASDLLMFEQDYMELTEYIQKKCPDAQIVIVDDFWDSEKSKIKKRVAEKCKVSFADLEEIRGKKEYQCGLGTVVYDTEGNEHVVKHEGVAIHPGDLGMQYIAEQIEKCLY